MTSFATGGVLKINVGGPAVAGYGADNPAYIQGSSIIATNTNTITVPTGVTNAAVYASERYTTDPSFKFRIPVPVGRIYTVWTEHVETFFNGDGLRKFTVRINQFTRAPDIDVFKRVGMSKAHVLRFKNVTPDSTGFISIELMKRTENPMINGIVIETTGYVY